jgi:hypothetical protein
MRDNHEYIQSSADGAYDFHIAANGFTFVECCETGVYYWPLVLTDGTENYSASGLPESIAAEAVSLFGQRYRAERATVRGRVDVRLTGQTDSDELWSVIRDGHTAYHDSDYRSQDSALLAAFHPFADGGYAMVYANSHDGSILCSACVRKAWSDHADADHIAIRTGQIVGMPDHEPSSTGQACEGCNQYLPGCAPHCADCTTDLDDEKFHGPVFVKESGDVLYCARCVAERIVNGYAEKTGRLAYDLYAMHGRAFWDGSYSAAG